MRMPLLLCLLILTTWVDDAFALATPEPGDDAVAAANNEFLPSAAATAPAAQPAAVPGAPPAVAVPGLGALAAAGATAAACPFGPAPLYLLMSLRL